jgi:peptidoglycan/LPS O-acetylase OafA/YrhL
VSVTVNQRVRRLGQEPALDGLRALAVVAVVLYHVHSLDPTRFGLFRGGFFGVELFFVVSGYLITALMLQEIDATGGVALGQFWLRRARRLLPALAAMLVAVGIAAVLWRPETVGRLRTDLLPAVFYWSNWRQIFSSGSGYFAQLQTPPLLRHLWSLAIEEQWYLVWPVVLPFVAKRQQHLVGRLLLAGGLAAAGLGIVLYDGSETRANLVYLATFTRASGLLLGAALAAVWRPWKSSTADARSLPELDVIGLISLVVLFVVMSRWANTSGIVYRGGMLLVSVLSVLLIAVATHPAAHTFRMIIGSRPLVTIGRRSYGLYLWHWPILVLTNAVSSTARLLLVLAAVAVVTEASYRFIEQPIRAGAFGAWWNGQGRSTVQRLGYGVAAVALVGPLTLALARSRTTDIVVGGRAESFELATTTTTLNPALAETATTEASGAAATTTATTTTATTTTATTTTATTTTATTTTATTTTATTTTAAAAGPVRVVIVGDSQAESLARNLPSGIETVFTISDGSVDGCGVWDDGEIWSRFKDYKRKNQGCVGWPAKWAASVTAAKADIALVAVGAWDVFDVAYVEGVTQFNTAKWDAKFTANLNKGIAAASGAGAKVALLEVPCFNPVESKGATVPPLTERGEPWRTAHVNQLLKQIALADPTHVSFVAGPTQWCANGPIATDLNYRWDGVHVYRPGAKLVFDTIAPALLALPD